MTGWHFIAADVHQYDNGTGWVAWWVFELTEWPARLERWLEERDRDDSDGQHLTSVR